eukprot:6667452-Alexandrium_andersonii.AAC.1
MPIPSNNESTTSSFPFSSSWLSSAMGLTGARPAGPPASAIPVARGSRRPSPAWLLPPAPWAGPWLAPSPSAMP